MTIKRRLHLNQSGAVTPSMMIGLFLVTVAIYICYMAVPPYFAFYMMKTEVQEEAKLAHQFSDETIALNIMNKAGTWKIPIIAEDIVISRGYTEIDIKLDYSQKIEFLPGYIKVITFHIAVSETIKDTSGLLL